MNPESYKRVWQAEASHARITIHQDQLLKEVQRNQRFFAAHHFFSDCSGLLIAVLMIPLWIYIGISASSPWTWYLMIPIFLGTAGVMISITTRGGRAFPEPGPPLIQCIKDSLYAVQQRISLQRQAVKWSLLPTACVLLLSTTHTTLMKARDWQDALLDVNTVLLIFFVILFYFLFQMNGLAIRKYDDRRQELLSLLESLGEDPKDSSVSSEETPTMFADTLQPYLVAVLCIVTVVGIATLLQSDLPTWKQTVTKTRGGYAKLSPFSAIRWIDSQPVVQVNEKWFRLLAIDNSSVTSIIAFSRENHSERWKKRFEEDLVQILSEMGAPPKRTSTLLLETLDGSETVVMKSVLWSADNRQVIKKRAMERERERL